MPKKNPYLTQYKENISSQQRLIRQRLGQDNFEPDVRGGAALAASPDSDLKLHKLQTSLRNLPTLDNGDIPSIDGENIRETDQQEAEAEKSLQFFKKNLLPTSQTRNAAPRPPSALYSRQDPPSKGPLVQTTRPKSIARDPQERSRELRVPERYQRQKSTGSLFDRQPSLSSVVRDDESAFVARSRAPLEAVPASRTTSATTRVHNEKAPLPLPPVFTPPAPAAASRRAPSERQALRSSRPASSELRAADELELARAGLSSLALARKSPAPRLPESPIPAETFARKPLNNSLLRAHDSIRLKVNRPKVRSTSLDDDDDGDQRDGAPASKQEDTVLDDDIQLAEIRDPSAPGDLSEERAVDVKRRSSRKNKSKSKKKKRQDEGDVDDESHKVPVRNFSEVRVVKVVRSEEERSLGVSVEVDSGNIMVARVFAGGLADKQGALQAGDIILAVNNREVYTPEQMQEQLRQSIMDDTVLLKIVPSFREELPTLCIYLRALFDYDPNEDSLSPCKVKGVAFNRGDILEVINQEDNNYWQARRVDSENLETGLIPSQELEERRRAFVIPDYDLATKFSMCGTKVSRKLGKKLYYNVGQNCDFDKADLQLYEEVCRTPAFERRTLVLIGANGVGKQALKARLVNTDPDRFGTPLPHTSRLPRDGEEDGIHYHFVTRERMEEDIIAGKYLEYGEYDGALYGTKLDSVREIIGSGRVCVLDCSPTCLKVLKTSDYLPFVAFIAAPTLDQLRYLHDWNRGNKTYATFDRALSRQSRRAKTLQDFAFDFFEDEDLQVTVEESARLFRIYENYFDIVLVNNDFNRTFEQLRDAIDALSQAPQWIPISWIYGT